MSNPKPSFGWFIKISVAAIVALMLVAAMRTAFAFGISAFTSINSFLKDYVPSGIILFISGIEAFAAVFGIEGLIVVYGMKEGLSKGDNDLKGSRAIASYIALGISCMAGLFQNGSMIGDASLMTSIERVLMITTGFGVPIAIMFAAPYLGMMMNFQIMQYARWLAEARKAYESSRERQFARSELTTASRQQNRSQPRLEAVQSLPDIRTNELNTAEVVSWFRKQHELSDGDAISAAKAADEYYQAHNIVPVNGDMSKLQVRIRTYLSRERAERKAKW